MFLRRSAAALAATTVLCAVAAPLAAASPVTAPGGAPAAAGKGDAGLYGEADPTYDGVWRQSLALLAQDTAGVTPAKKSVGWLAAQQCDDGSFASYRADPGAPCGKKTVADTNATAAAVQALSVLGGHGDAVGKAVDWLKSVQNDDGGWGYNPGSPSDANSVSVVIGALEQTGQDPERTTAGKKDATPYDALLGLRLGCDAKAGERGAFAYQPDKKGALAPNTDATAAATLAGEGDGFVVEPLEKDENEAVEALACGGGGGDRKDPEDAAEAGAAYLTGVLKKNDWHLMSALPGSEDQPDYGNTADAVLALAAGGHGDAARSTVGWLEKHHGDWDKHASSPAALGQLVLAAHATGTDPRDFGGTDLVKRLNATGPEPAAVEEPKSRAEEEKEDEGDTVTLVSTVAAFLVAGIGIGILLSGRGKRKQ
ncbi:terpene cyclase/mutase family protein [Streptomyces sp. DSM 42041]|uniref:Terpene cyclase/mutase family protein n=1 Tax=Streptomyces hazeniae TaxID=3075538 RepID=A0ABU2NJK1_9ACTN|nr:prenyltransferase/squalene oxidase repeat-containing protein [Streptomyces sp. DSM 42041]MDT0377174.1 terpene cyclase/mutase family protein [Streptomyces sp. DSM 42041]